jgi:hypothetical protein
MNTKHLLAASLAGGLISAVLVNTPFVNLINLLICAGFWIGPIAAVWLYRHMAGPVTMRQAITVGLLAGVWHGLFGLLLSPLGLAGAGGLLNDLRPILSAQDLGELQSILTGIGGLMFNLLGVVTDVVFGLIGGLVAGAIFRTKNIAMKAGA